MTDLAFQTNYWFGFPNSNSDVIIGLTMWQYWWWFWFTYYMCVYYFIFLRLIRHRTLKFSPKIVTSQKAHGKWGDFIICLVPISWCANILSNSNFIMRMLEWQTESSLFTVRIRGRQWYWVYKIELKDLLRSEDTSKNIGHDYWEGFNLNSDESIAAALNHVQIRNHNKEYLSAYKQNVASLAGKAGTYATGAYTLDNFGRREKQASVGFFEEFAPDTLTKNFADKKMRAAAHKSGDLFSSNAATKGVSPNAPMLEHNSFNDNKRFARVRHFALIKNLNLTESDRGVQASWTKSANTVSPKTTADNMYFVLKQKRFAAPIQRIATIDIEKNAQMLRLNNFSTLELSEELSHTRKWSAKRLKYKSGTVPLAYSKRLLRTRRVLVLPSQVNITLITNSFDVVHSWYIPGLGVKLDCIPGRSTHHTIFIDHAGFYYGQCAEICGRYHHHMPIRVCALPFEHFLIWWYHYGLPYFNATATDRKTSVKSGIRQYAW